MEKRVSYNISLSGLDGGTVKVGEMVATGERCVFRYHEPFLGSSGAFSLDPKNLSSKKKQYATDKTLFGVFEDSLPDSWGRKLMRARYQLSHAEQSPHLLLSLLDKKSIGALGYELLNEPAVENNSESIDAIGDLARAARAFEKGELVDGTMLQRLFNSAGSPGGAHPKASVYGKKGKLLLVKFPSLTDRYDIVGLEASCLELAKLAGIDVPVFSIMEAGGVKMLCLERFDRTENGCKHMISMQSLLNVSGYYHSSYVQMADVIREICKDPERDLHALFRQMIFNAVIGNTDDHLKNFSLLYDHGYRLTPAYDLLPNVNQNIGHTLAFSNNDIAPARDEAVGSLARRFVMRKNTAEDIVDKIITIVSDHWTSVCKVNGVPEGDICLFAKHIKRQREKLAA